MTPLVCTSSSTWMATGVPATSSTSHGLAFEALREDLELGALRFVLEHGRAVDLDPGRAGGGEEERPRAALVRRQHRVELGPHVGGPLQPRHLAAEEGPAHVGPPGLVQRRAVGIGRAPEADPPATVLEQVGVDRRGEATERRSPGPTGRRCRAVPPAGPSSGLLRWCEETWAEPPPWSKPGSAPGPMTASEDSVRGRGSTASSLRSSVTDEATVRRARALRSGVSSACSSGRPGSSKRPAAGQQVDDPPSRLVDHRLRHLAALDGLGQVRAELLGRTRHLEVEPAVGGADRVVGGVPVGDDRPRPAPLLLQHLHLEAMVLGGEGAADAVVGGHHGPRVGVGDDGLEGSEVELPQRHLVDLGRDRHALELLVVGHEVLDARAHACALEAVDEGDGQPGGQLGILRVALEAAAGEGVAVQVHGGARAGPGRPWPAPRPPARRPTSPSRATSQVAPKATPQGKPVDVLPEVMSPRAPEGPSVTLIGGTPASGSATVRHRSAPPVSAALSAGLRAARTASMSVLTRACCPNSPTPARSGEEIPPQRWKNLPRTRADPIWGGDRTVEVEEPRQNGVDQVGRGRSWCRGRCAGGCRARRRWARRRPSRACRRPARGRRRSPRRTAAGRRRAGRGRPGRAPRRRWPGRRRPGRRAALPTRPRSRSP